MSKERMAERKHAGNEDGGRSMPDGHSKPSAAKTLARDELTPILSRFERLIQDLAR